MTPDQQLQILVETQRQFHDLLEVERFIAILGAVVATIPGFLLVWLEHRRDKEIIKLRRVIGFAILYKDDRVQWKLEIALQVTNLSQFPIKLTAAGYNIGGKGPDWGPPAAGYQYFYLAPGDIPFLAAERQLPAVTIGEPADAGPPSKNRERIQWPLEIPARTTQWLYAGEDDVKGIKTYHTGRGAFEPPALHPKFRLFVKPATGDSVYDRNRRTARVVAATRELLSPIRKAIAEMRGEE
jgi:hypothetical protein